MTKQLLALLCFVLSSTKRIASTSSTGPCDQSSLQGRFVLNCKGKGLQVVPHLVINEPVYDELTLAENQIVRLESSAFGGVRMRRLDLSGNPLIFVAPDAFQGLGDVLESLHLTFDPSLSVYPADSFRQIPNLLSTEITGHGFLSLSRSDFEGCRKLQRLSLTRGALPPVTVDLFQGLRDTLLALDLHLSELTVVPTDALSQLQSLKSLNLAENKISSLGSKSFGELKVEVLDLSTQVYSMSDIHESAFSGLESTLKNLSLASLSLNSQHLQALKQLTRLVDLDLSRNKITRLDGLFNTLTLLKKLNLQDNPIVTLNEADFRNGASILVLNLANNKISSMDRNSFAGLTSLVDLDLENSRGLTLDENTFSAQRKTLKYLKLQNSNFLKSQWSAIERLTELDTLFLYSCDLDNIPDFIFRGMKKLRSIDLKSNRIDALTQNSLAGLENSLEILNLYGNRIQTMDQCVFRGFTKISLFHLNIQKNPLQCDCGLHWMHLWFSTNSDTYRKKNINWSCANLNDTFFRDLNDSNFASCDQSPPSNTPPPCHQGPSYTTDLPGNTDPDRMIVVVEISSFRVVNATQDTLMVMWEISSNESVVGFTFTCEPTSGGDRRFASLESTIRSSQVESLAPSTTYKVCLKVRETEVTACLNETTLAAGLSLALIYGVSIGAGVLLLALLLLVIVVVCCCVTSTSRRNDDVIKVEPKLGDNTKRFQKPAQLHQQGSSVSELHKTRSIAEQLGSLTDDERYRLINLLTHSGGSIASLDFCQGSLPRQRYVTQGANSVAHSLPHDQRYVHGGGELARHDYDCIQDDEFYDEISMDDIV